MFNLGQLVDVSLTSGSHRAGDCDRCNITGSAASQAGGVVRKGTGKFAVARLDSGWRLDPALADCHRSTSTGDQVQRCPTHEQPGADSSNPPHHRGSVEGGQREESSFVSSLCLGITLCTLCVSRFEHFE